MLLLSDMSGILYCAVSRGSTILCSKQRDGSGNFESVAESMIQNINVSTNTRTSYSAEQ